ncbi:hypothetical protein FB451DRAFT_1485909 [Mycena latifolia]|nr:hypothetical protein FB451DRAFT_1485909 [Mycena latifolia]
MAAVGTVQSLLEHGPSGAVHMDNSKNLRGACRVGLICKQWTKLKKPGGRGKDCRRKERPIPRMPNIKKRSLRHGTTAGCVFKEDEAEMWADYRLNGADFTAGDDNESPDEQLKRLRQAAVSFGMRSPGASARKLGVRPEDDKMGPLIAAEDEEDDFLIDVMRNIVDMEERVRKWLTFESRNRMNIMKFKVSTQAHDEGDSDVSLFHSMANTWEKDWWKAGHEPDTVTWPHFGGVCSWDVVY